MKNLLKPAVLLILFFTMAFTPSNDKKIIVIDAGHGGQDIGSQNSSIIEKDYTLKIAKRLIDENTNPNIEFVLLRESDELIELHSRVERINELKPDMVVSLHLNKSTNKDQNGIEVFVSPENIQYEKSKELAESLMSHFEASPLAKRGVKEQRFKIIRESESPALLFELGFVSNETDAAYLESKEGQDDIVQKLFSFINGL